MKHEINELYPSARRAYYSIDLAVKTKSTPVIFNSNSKFFINFKIQTLIGLAKVDNSVIFEEVFYKN